MNIIKIHLQTMSQLFDSLDPAPFREKALGSDAHRYLVESVTEFMPSKQIKLVVCGPKSLESCLPEIRQAIHSHFQGELESLKRHAQWQLRLGRTALIMGLSILAIALLIQQALIGSGSRLSIIVGEGLKIVGWVGLWRPAELLIYNQLENLAEKSIFYCLSTIDISFEELLPDSAP